MQINEINERVKVGAVFDHAGVIPKWFLWRSQKHEVRGIEHSWKVKEGETPQLFLNVLAGRNIYQLQLNQSTLEWRLERIYLPN
jgi:hypothetical protein